METNQFHITDMDLFFRKIFFCISVVPMNYLVSTRNCHRDERTWVLVSGHYIFLLSNDFPVNFQVFINIHEYAKKIIYIYGQWMKELVKLYHL